LSVLLAVRFLFELAMLAALAWGGYHLVDDTATGLLLAVLLTGAAVVVWGRWVAPRSSHRLRDPARACVEVALFVVAFVLLTQADPQPDTVVWGLVMLVGYLVSMPARHVAV
jgi:hypothetical protein